MGDLTYDETPAPLWWCHTCGHMLHRRSDGYLHTFRPGDGRVCYATGVAHDARIGRPDRSF